MSAIDPVDIVGMARKPIGGGEAAVCAIEG
jgi:hypothetical protein